MRRHSACPAPLAVLLFLGASLAMILSGCATTGTAPARAAGGAIVTPPAEASAAQAPMAKVPMEISIHGTPRAGDSWKSRFVSTSEMKRTFAAAGGKETVKARTVGLELVAAQKVVSVTDGKARIEVTEQSSRILQEGKFIEAPFKRLNPPSPVFFTLDLATGKADFSEMQKAYGEWMTAVKEGPAGEIFGKTFHIEAYVGQLRELYGRPFSRFLGKKLSKEPRPGPAGDFVQPFLGPGVALGPVPVETSTWYEGFEATGGMQQIKAAGKYDGTVAWTLEELKDRMDDFEAPVPAAFRPSGEVHGRYTSTVDILAGREIRSQSQLRYSAAASFEGGTLTEEITGKSILEPAD